MGVYQGSWSQYRRKGTEECRYGGLNVPLLTIVPIPYIAINSVDINFKANINASSSSVSENSSHTEYGGEVDAKAKLNLGLFSLEANLKANYSTKKDSKATEESKYSVESTIDVAVKAGQESMPAGMAKILEMLNGAVDTVDVKGELSVNTDSVKVGEKLFIIYKTPEGLYAPEKVAISGQQLTVEGNQAVFEPKEAGNFTITAGDSTLVVKVVKDEPKNDNPS